MANTPPYPDGGRTTWPLRGMVDFLGIGAQKAGTTWIFENLQRHPDVQFPGGKEIHFWDAQRHRGVQWWLRGRCRRRP